MGLQGAVIGGIFVGKTPRFLFKTPQNKVRSLSNSIILSPAASSNIVGVEGTYPHRIFPSCHDADSLVLTSRAPQGQHRRGANGNRNTEMYVQNVPPFRLALPPQDGVTWGNKATNLHIESLGVN
jgi:hypothetical protein